ncbi:MAG: hypothetical protein U0804_20615 [Gemmataceae bacterium]
MPARSLWSVAAFGLFAIAVASGQPPRPAGSPGDGIKRTNEENFKLYKKFADDLLSLAQKWEKSDNPDEKARAKSLRAALKIGEERGVENLFRGVLAAVQGAKAGPQFDDLIAKDATLLRALEEILETLETEDESDRIRREILSLKEFIKETQRIKRDQENLLARTNLPKSDANKLAKDQANLAKETQNLANKLGKDDPKAGEPKPGAGEPKDGMGEPKPGEKQGDNAAEPKTGGEPKPGDPKAGEPKAGEPKAGEPKAGDPKAGGDRPMGDPKMGEPKAGGDPKAGEPKGGMPMAGEPKAAGEKKGMGDGKGDSKAPPKEGGGEVKPGPPSPGMPMGGMPPPGGAKPPPPGGNKAPPPGGPRPPNPNNPNDEARRNLEDAVPPQDQAKNDLQKNDRDNASKKEDEAIKALDRALAELEKRLQQLREKEMLKKLEDLERRVTRMLRMQVEVYEATKSIDTTVTKNKGQKTTADIQKAGIEAEKEGEIASDAGKALRLLEGEGKAVVFAGVLGEVQKDMLSIQKQLNGANTGADTQLVEEQVIEQLQRMLEALKKAQNDLKNPPPPPPPGMPPPPNDKKDLIQLVEQLKLLRDLQRQVNDRTTAFGRRVTGEQAMDPFIQEQLRMLGDRQRVLQNMLNRIAEQFNQ